MRAEIAIVTVTATGAVTIMMADAMSTDTIENGAETTITAIAINHPLS
jgi:cellobiose-specific phosphotransferase system component IIB